MYVEGKKCQVLPQVKPHATRHKRTDPNIPKEEPHREIAPMWE